MRGRSLFGCEFPGITRQVIGGMVAQYKACASAGSSESTRYWCEPPQVPILAATRCPQPATWCTIFSQKEGR